MLGIAPGRVYLPIVNNGFEDLGRSLPDTATALANLPQFKALYPSSMDASAFATKLLGSMGLQADATAHRLVVDLFNAGVPPERIILEAVLAIDSSTAPEYAAARALQNNKADVAFYHAQLPGRTETDFALLSKVLDNVTQDPASVDTAKLVLNPPPPPASSGGGGGGSSSPTPPPPTANTGPILTTGLDHFSGGNGDDLVQGVIGAQATFNPTDTISGGGGTDTLALTGVGTASIDPARVTTIERVIVTTNDLSLSSSIINLNSSASVQVAGNVGSTAPSGFVRFWNVAPNTHILVKDTSVTTDLEFSGSLAGINDTAHLTLDNANGVVKISSPGSGANQFETLSLTSTGTKNSLALFTDANQASLRNIKIGGDAALKFEFPSTNTRTLLTNIDASTATGSIQIGVPGTPLGPLPTNTMTVKMGSGDDKVYFGATLDVNDVVDGGAGRDTLGVSTPVTDDMMAGVSNFEVIEFDASNLILYQDARIPSLAGYDFAVRGSAVLMLGGLANNANVNVVGDISGLFPALASYLSTSDSLNLTLTGGVKIDTLGETAGLEILQLSSVGSAANVIKSSSNASAHVLTGNANLTFSDALATASFDASAFSGNLNVTAKATGTSIIGGTGNDTLTGGAGADVLNGGSGDDIIQLAKAGTSGISSADIITTGSGNDIVRYVGNDASGNGSAMDLSAFSRIIDFNVGTEGNTDRLSFSANDADFRLTTFGGNPTYGLAKGSLAQGLQTSDQIVIQDVGQAPGTVSATANVSFFKLTEGVSSQPDIAHLFSAATGGEITGLANGGNYLVAAYNTTDAVMVIGLVNVSSDSAASTSLSAQDFSSTGISIVGMVSMTAADYASFGVNQLAAAF